MSAIDTANRALRRVPTWVVYSVVALWLGWRFWLGLTGQLGAEPIRALERDYGKIALQLLVVTLLVTPLRRWPGLNLMKFRRALGLSAFFAALAHLLVFALLDVQTWERVWTEVVKRPYVTVGMAGFLLLLPLALTSNDRALRRLGGAAWRQLHKLTYPAALLAALHYVWLVKGFQIEPLLYMAGILGLLALRLKWKRARRTGRAAA